ncbi:MAG: hypothetical protein WA755_14000 [Candidatus Acidiferrales bacterium]
MSAPAASIPAHPRATGLTYAGVLLLTLATLMHEILLTRIFSVTMLYHFAFMAISLSMFGLTLGALTVYLHPNDYVAEKCKRQMTVSALFFSLTVIVSLLTHLLVPVAPSLTALAAVSLVFTYVVMSGPFFFSGICICAALTKFPHQISRLYAADLVGAALGCVVLIFTLKFTDGLTAVFVVAFLGSASAILFALDGSFRMLRRVAILSSVLLAIFVIVNSHFAHRQAALLRLTWTEGKLEPRPLYEKWNSFSRITVSGDPNHLSRLPNEGLSPAYPADQSARQLNLTIDANAGTVLTAFTGDLSEDDFLKYDIKQFVHYLRPNSNELIIGAGAGRDVLAALLFHQKSIRAVELNGDILRAVNQRYGDFTGHLDRYPQVTFINDEARSYLTRTPERFDIIQASFIDTWAATAAGAFTLSENSLYTTEAWKLILHRLTPTGIFSSSRWYFQLMPAEVYRLTCLAATALLQDGVTNPRAHIILLRHLRPSTEEHPQAGAATMLVSRAPFTPEEIDRVEDLARRLQFELVLTPRYAIDPAFAALGSGNYKDSSLAGLPFNLSPPTDDCPFFFNLFSFRHAFDTHLWKFVVVSMQGVFVLGVLLIAISLLTLLCIAVPFVRTVDRKTLPGSLPHFLFFAAIGLGFMLIEVSQMERLIVFLGHPTYALSVVLFALLLSSGLGSFSTQSAPGDRHKDFGIARLLLLLVVVFAFGILTPRAVVQFAASTTPERIAIATAILFPLGFFMGMALPLGLRSASVDHPALTPWFWAINGAASIFASVLAVAISMGAGISRTFWTGFFAYAVACAAYLWAQRGAPTLAAVTPQQIH